VVTVDSELVALERSTGAVRWVSQLRRFENPNNRRDRVSWTGPLMANGKLVLAASTGEIAIVDPQTGTTERTLNGGAAFFIPPVAMDGAIYLLGANAQLVALR
jgi:outer membrane protein assembly factor BamB